MNLAKFLLSAGLLIALIFILSKPLPMGEASTPPIGKFLSPTFGFWQNAEDVEAVDFSEKVDLPNLNSTVDVAYDDKLVPHIFADNMEDGAFIQGYITAQHRLWQMEFQTHAAAGRLSEIVGARAINFDKINRRTGMTYGAKNTYEQWKKSDHFPMLEAYAKGVNAYINQLSPKDYPIEYKILDYAPEAWTSYKSALLMTYMAQSLAKHDGDMERTNALKHFGKETFEFLFPDDFPDQDPIIPKGTEWDFEPTPLRAETPTIEKSESLISYQLEPRPYPGIGSNNWAVDSSKTKNGNPILCSDPHLHMTLPSIWFELQLHIPGANAYGVSLPGMPGIIIGFNENVAWGQTNVGRDVLDWYKITWKDKTREEYLLDGSYKKVEKVVEEIKVKGGKTVYDTVLYTHHGPVVYENADNPKQDMALRWIAHYAGTGSDLSTFAKLNKAKNYDDYVDAIMNYDLPAQNYVFASREGDIALWTQGIYPLKAEEQGRFVLDGSSSTNDWHGWIPKKDNPHIKNPERGFVASANQHSTDSTYPYYYRGGFADYRGRILNQRLTAMNDITVQDMMELQFYSVSLKPQEALPPMVQHINAGNLTEKEKTALESLQTWDFDFAKDSKAATVFDVWFDEMYELLWDEFLSFDEEKTPMESPETWRTIALLKDTPDHPFFDIKKTEKKETIADVVTQSLKKACEKITAWEAKNKKEATWSNYKATRVSHLAKIPGFSHEGVEVGGDRSALNAVSQEHGPSWRMVVELGKDEVTAYGVYPGGQSGNPGSPYYNDFINKWATGTYYPLLFMKSAKEENDRIIARQTFN